MTMAGPMAKRLYGGLIMRIHVRTAMARRKPQNGYKKIFKGMIHDRISTRFLMLGWNEEKGEGLLPRLRLYRRQAVS